MNLEHAQTAMKIILHAGDAREKTMDALKALDTFDIENAKELLKQANEAIVQAHQVQTDALQAESRGEELEYSILFSHAQDTCMCASSELNVAMHLVDLFEVIDKRFKKIRKINNYLFGRNIFLPNLEDRR